MSDHMRITLRFWRQKGPDDKGHFETHRVDDVSPHQSFLEMLDQLNDALLKEGKEPLAFDSDCREGICGTCGFVINGQAHGPLRGVTVCQLHMRNFRDGDVITVEPWRARPFPVVKDLIVDKRAFDQILMAGGYISVKTGSAPDANAIPISRKDAEEAFDAAACIGCGACVAACKNASAMLFVSAKVAHLAYLPQGRPERKRRALRMMIAHEMLGFGNCTNESECEAACPKEISVKNISLLNREFTRAALTQTA